MILLKMTEEGGVRGDEGGGVSFCSGHELMTSLGGSRRESVRICKASGVRCAGKNVLDECEI